MSNNFIILNLFYFLSVISTLGYGFFLNKGLISKSINIDYGIQGLTGIFVLTLYSYLSHFFISHNLFHNSILFLTGIFLFIFFFKSNYKKNNFIILCLVFIIILIAFFSFKTHDDFPYYHFPYTNYLSKSDIIIGVGNYDPSWRSPSSIFYFNSLFYLPFIKYHSYHIGALLIMGFSLLTMFLRIYERYKLKKYDQLFFYKLLSAGFILIFFYRLSEHGTDRSAQILSFILILEIMYLFNKEQNLEKFFIKIFLIGSLAISLKVFYLIYLILLIPVFYFIFIERKNFYFAEIIKNRFFYLSVLFLLLVTSVNFLNSGCLIYPLTISCFENFSWSIPLNEIDRMRFHYENWSKAGAGPNFTVENIRENIVYFNWLPGWVERYFFNKMSDYLLGLTTMSLIYFLVFFSNKKKNINKRINLKLLYFSLIILFIEWFYNHPTLRYGGYYIIAILIFIPLSKTLSDYHNDKYINKKLTFVILIIISIFTYRNMDRIFVEHVKYNYSPFKSVYYNIDKNHFFRIEREFDKTIKFYNQCTKKRIECNNLNKLLAYKKYGKFIFVDSSKYKVKDLDGKDILIKIK